MLGFKRAVSSALALVLLLGSMTVFPAAKASAAPVPLFDGATYFTDTDNWGGGLPGSPADNDLDESASRIKNGSAKYPIEFKIENVTQLPRVSAQLLVRGYDVDEKTGNTGGEWDRVYLSSKHEDIQLNYSYTNWNYTKDANYRREFNPTAEVGALSGENNTWNTTSFSLTADQFDRIAAGDNYVGISIHHHYSFSSVSSDWETEIDWAQLVIDGGQKQSAEIKEAAIEVSAGKVHLDADFLAKLPGDYFIEANVIETVGGEELNLKVESELYEDANGGDTENWQVDLSNPSINPSKEYVINVMLFEADGTGKPREAQHVLSFSTYDMKAADFEKRVLADTEFVFAPADFQDAFFKNSGAAGATDIANGSNLQVVTIHSLPDPNDGKLFYDGVELTDLDIASGGYEVYTTDLSKLTFMPEPTMGYDTEFEWSGYGQGKATGNQAIVTLKKNHVPTVEHIEKEANKGDTVPFEADDFRNASFEDTLDGDDLTQVKIVSVPDPAKGKLQLVDGSVRTDVVDGQEIPVADLGKLVFVPEPNVSGAVTFEWNGHDGYQYAEEAKNVTIAINTPPVAGNISKTGPMGTVIVLGDGTGNDFAASYADADSDALNQVRIVVPNDFAAKGQLYYNTVTDTVYATPGVPFDIPAASLDSVAFTPAAELPNGASVALDWYGHDGKQFSESPGQLTIAYNGIPSGENRVVDMQEGTPQVIVQLRGTDTEPTVTGLVYGILSTPTHGTLEPADPGNPQGDLWIYTPDPDFTGIDSFTYTVTDAASQTSSPATVTVNVHKALDGWVGHKERGDASVLPNLPGYPLKLSAVSTLAAEQVTANVNGVQVPLIWVNQATSMTDGYKLWEKTNTVLPAETNPGQYDVTFTAEDALGGTLPAESPALLADNRFEVLNASVTLAADPAQILGDGRSTTTLTAVVKLANGQPVAGVEVTFDAPLGTFPEGVTAITDANGIAKVPYQSAAITGVLEQQIPVTATVLDPGRGISSASEIEIKFLPAQVKGILTTGDDNTPVAGATVRVTLDLNGDRIIEAGVDFDQTVITGADGSYAVAVPKGDSVYELEVTRNVVVGGVAQPITYRQQAAVGSAAGGAESYESEKTVTGLVLFKQPDGETSLLSPELLNRTTAYIKDADGHYILEGGSPKPYPLTEQGVFNSTGLAVGSYTLEIRYEVSPGKEITFSRGTVQVTADGELNITEQLVDPYGTITDAVTGDVIEGAKVTLYYADTPRNTAGGKLGGTPVTLPELVGFEPNDNASPEQLTDAHGFYAYMVYPETDYYLVITKDNYQSYRSPMISVEWDIVRHDAQLHPFAPVYVAPQPTLTVAVTTEKSIVREGSESKVTVSYKNESGIVLKEGELVVTLPEGTEVVDADGGKVDGRTVTWTIESVAGGQGGTFELVVRYPAIGQAEQELTIMGALKMKNVAAVVAAESNAKLTLFSERYGNQRHQRYILGYPDGEFKLADSMSRAELAAIVARLTENEPIDSALPFKDIREGHWASNYIRIAVKHGYFGGFADGTFRPDADITRGELAAVMARYLKMSTGAPVERHFSDTQGHWGGDAVEALYRGKFLTGYEDRTFRPNQVIRRDEAVTMINRMLYRGPLLGLDPVFPDVPQSHWAFGDVQEATVSHESVRNEDGSETFVGRIDDEVK